MRESDDILALFQVEEDDEPENQIDEAPEMARPSNPDAIDGADFLLSNQDGSRDAWKPWMDSKQFILGTVDNLAQIIDECINSKRYAIDLETSGLDNRVKETGGILRTVDSIAGVCLSPDGVKGYYIPLHHVKEEHGIWVDRECNIPITLFDREFRRLIDATEKKLTVAVFHNGKFDQEFLQFNETGRPWGEWDIPGSWDDTLILAYLRNSRARVKGLKALSKAPRDAHSDSPTGGPGLGLEMISLFELWGHKKEKKGVRYDFTMLDPSEGPPLWYGCSDAICTYLLYPILAPTVLDTDTDGKNQSLVYTAEKVCVAATRWMERNRIHIDRAKVQELISLGQQEWYESIMDVYTEAQKLLGRDVMPEVYKVLRQTFVASDPRNLVRDQLDRADSATKHLPHPQPVVKNGKRWPAVYDVNSQQQLGTMFEELNVPGLKVTEKSGQVKTSKAELERIVEEAGDRFPFMKKIRRFREVSKALSTYLEPMLLDSDPSDDMMRINFNGHKVDTGRYSTPAKESAREDSDRNRMVGWPQVNLQATPSTADPKRPACMNRLRECYTARPTPPGRPKKYIVAIDYAGVELRLATNLSREPKWLNEFFHCSTCDRTFEKTQRSNQNPPTQTPLPPPARCPNCGSDKIGDLHTLTALAIYGQDAPTRENWKALRGYAKATNFALSYGGGGGAVVRATGVDKNEGNRIKNQFDHTYFGLKNWWLAQHKQAKTYGYVRTAFGRKYPVPDIHSEDGGFRSKAERNSVNGPIQGTSADITKMAMALIYKECKQRGWLDKVMMIITMHDELVFEIDGDLLEQAIPVLVDLMVSNAIILAQSWPIPLTTDVEIGHDWMVPWDLNAMRYREVRFEGNKKYKEPQKPKPEAFKTAEEFHQALAEFPGKLAAWKAMQHSWPEELRMWFRDAGGNPTPSSGGGLPSETPPAPVDVTPASLSVMANPVLSVTAPEQVAVPAGEDFVYRLRSAMSLRGASELAHIIMHCMNKGTSTLHLVSSTGQPILGWESELGVQAIKVNPQEFFTLARYRDL